MMIQDFDQADKFDSRNPEFDTDSDWAVDKDLYNKVLKVCQKLPHTITETQFGSDDAIVIESLEDEDVAIQLIYDGTFYVCGCHNGKQEIEFTTITKKNVFAVTPDLIKGMFEILEFKLA